MKKLLLKIKRGILKNYILQGEDRVSILLYGDIGNKEKVDPEEVVTQLMELENKYSNIDIHINSNGGDVFSGISIYNALCNSKADICIYVDGIAASIAGIIALCGKPLFMSQYARLMIHSVSGGVFGNKIDLQNMIAVIENTEDTIAEMISRRCNTPKEEIKKNLFDGKDHWITAREALSMGIIDGIHDIQGQMPESLDKSNKDDIYNFFQNKLVTIPQTSQEDMELLNKIRKIPSFSGMESQEQVLERIRELEKSHESRSLQPEKLLNMAIANRIIDRQQADEILQLSDGDINKLQSYIDKKARQLKMRNEREYADIVKNRSEFGLFSGLSDSFINQELKDFALSNLETFKKIAQATRKKRVMDYIVKPGTHSPSNERLGWTLNDYRKNDPKELQRNPGLYKRLLEESKQTNY